MRQLHKILTITILLLLWGGSIAFGQEVWTVDLRGVDEDLPQRACLSLIFRDVVGRNNGSVQPYYWNDSGNRLVATSPLSMKSVCVIDTQWIINPVMGEEIVLQHKEIDLCQCHKYRIVSERKFDWVTGTTIKRIKFIGPIRKLYDDSGRIRGEQTLFFIRFSDALSILKAYDSKHPGLNLERSVWSLVSKMD